MVRIVNEKGVPYWTTDSDNNLLFNGEVVGIVGLVKGKVKARFNPDKPFDLGRAEAKALDGFLLFLGVMRREST